jgi:hypothetical protein
MTREPDGELSFRTPHGWLAPGGATTGSGASPSGRDLRARNNALGVTIDPHTATPSWMGERVDLAYAIDVLHPLACGTCERKRAAGSA